MLSKEIESWLNEVVQRALWSDYTKHNYGLALFIAGAERYFRELYNSSSLDLVPFRLYGPLSGQSYLVRHPRHAHTVLNDTEHFTTFKLPMRRLRDLLGRNILTTNGPEWREHRDALDPALKQVKDFAPVMHQVIQAKIDKWIRLASKGRLVVDMGKEMSNLTMQVLARCLLGDQVTEEDIDNITQGSVDGLAALFPQLIQPLILPRWVPTLVNRRVNTAEHRLRSVSQKLIQHYLSQPEGSNLITKLLASNLPLSAIDANVRTMFIAGHETTAVALTWTAYHTARIPEYQKLFGTEKEAIWVAKESLRNSSPVWITGRVVRSAVTLGTQPLQCGDILHIPVLEIHRSTEWWGRDAQEYNPRRWEGLNLQPGMWLPFGAGPRICAGAAFAIMEMRDFLVSFRTQGGRFKLPTHHREPVEAYPGFTRKPRRPLFIEIEFIK